VPTLLASQGVDFTKSLAYTLIIAVASPVAALVATQIADRFERKRQLAWASLAIAAFGLLFSQQRTAVGLLVFGFLIGSRTPSSPIRYMLISLSSIRPGPAPVRLDSPIPGVGSA
jgi:MFS family permease